MSRFVQLTTLRLNDPKPPMPERPDDGEKPPRPRRPGRSQAAFLDRAKGLYQGAINDPALAAELATVGYPLTRLQAELADVSAVETADVTQEGEKAERKGGTSAQRTALKALDEWVSRFTGIVVPGPRDRPDLLAKMGLKPRWSKTPVARLAAHRPSSGRSGTPALHPQRGASVGKRSGAANIDHNERPRRFSPAPAQRSGAETGEVFFKCGSVSFKIERLACSRARRVGVSTYRQNRCIVIDYLCASIFLKFPGGRHERHPQNQTPTHCRIE